MICDLTIVEGDLLAVVNDVIYDAEGPMNLSSSTVKFQMASRGGVSKVNAAGTVTSALDGAVRYTWSGTDTDTPGVYYWFWEVTTSGKMMHTPRKTIFVEPNST